MSTEATRRRFLGLAIGSAASAGMLVASSAVARPEPKEEEGVAPGEDLMREHGVLKRVLLVYGEAIRRIDAHADLPPEPVADSAKIIHDFIEEYHEKLEEDQLFPRFRKANRLVDLVDVLDAQHKAGRKLTAQISRLATVKSLRDPDERRRLRTAMEQFIRMYCAARGARGHGPLPRLPGDRPRPRIRRARRGVREKGAPAPGRGRLREDGRPRRRDRKNIGNLRPISVHTEDLSRGSGAGSDFPSPFGWAARPATEGKPSAVGDAVRRTAATQRPARSPNLAQFTPRV